MATLYELTEKLRGFDLIIDDETGEILNAEELEEIELAFDDKVENYALWIKNLLSDAEAYKKEKEAFYRKEQQAKKKAEWLKARLEDALNGNTFKTTKVSITYRKSERVEVADNFNDERFITYEPKISKSAIKEALKSGEVIEGAQIIEANNMRIS